MDLLKMFGGNSTLMLVALFGLCAIGGILWWWLESGADKNAKSKKVSQFYSNRWMTMNEANTKYIHTTLTQIKTVNPKKSGAMVRFEQIGREMHVNFVPTDYHTIILGTTGSNKTQGYVLPFIYCLGHRGDKVNMVITDPKGEIYGYMAETLRRQGYDVQVLNLSEPSKSSRWNPFENAWNKFHRAHNIDREIKRHTNVEPQSLGLRIIAPSYAGEWFEFNKIAYPNYQMLENDKKGLKQRLLNEAETEIKDICSAICPVTNEKDPSWEEGARDLIQGTALAMLEDSLDPNNGMTKEKFNFYNIFRICGTRDTGDSMFKSLKQYFEGRYIHSAASKLAQTVVANVEKTMQNFLGVVTQKLSAFTDRGICYMTSATDVKFENFYGPKPVAFFLIIPDQIKARHTIATLCATQLYKSLVEQVNARGGKPPRETHFIMDEFGNMPKFNDFATIVTVSRSRGIRLNLVLQDYKQLETIYGPNDAVTIRNNCNTQIFLGVNDQDTRKIFSDLIGEMAIEVENKSVSKSTDKEMKDGKGGSESLSYQTVSRPLLPPNELLEVKPGMMYVYCFGFNPLRSKTTLFWQCLQNGLVQSYKEADKYIEDKFFDEEAVYYDFRARNDLVLNKSRKNEAFDW